MSDTSALRQQFEGIRDERRTSANTATRIGNALLALLDVIGNLDLDDKYISKINDDEAAGLITFRKGLISLLQARFGNYLRDGANDSGAAITPEGIGDFIGLIFTNYLKSRGARSGFTDGKGILMDAVRGIIETDGLEVRGFMRIMELVINRLQLMESDYSFTEGGESEHVDYAAGGRLLLRMHKRHDNDYTPFYYGDIIYAKVNDLLPKDAAVPNGHTATKNGSYYTVWMVVRDVDYTTNTLTVTLYNSLKPNGDPAVPGGYNFTPYGTPIQGTDDPSVAIADERAIVVDGHTLDETGFDCCITVTRHGNIADGVNPETGETDDQIRQRQEDRQQSWVLSTTDKRLSFFWHVDQPFIRDDNYALSLGMVPDLKNLPHDGSGRPLWDTRMPALYVNTIFYENIHHIYYPSRIVKVDRGAWTGTPLVTYSGPSGTYIPDGTLTAAEQLALGEGGTFTNGQTIAEPYHFESLTRNVWLTYRLADNWSDLSDRKLLDNLLSLWHVDIETSRAWEDGGLWECLEEGTSERPSLIGTKWTPISTPRISLGFFDTEGVPLLELPIREGAVINETIAPKLLFGQKDMTEAVKKWQWERTSAYTDLDGNWATAARAKQRVITLTDEDFPTGWWTAPLSFKCTAWFGEGEDETEIVNVINVF